MCIEIGINYTFYNDNATGGSLQRDRSRSVVNFNGNCRQWRIRRTLYNRGIICGIEFGAVTWA